MWETFGLLGEEKCVRNCMSAVQSFLTLQNSSLDSIHQSESNLESLYNVLSDVKIELSRWNAEVMKMSFCLAKLCCQSGGIEKVSDMKLWKNLCEEILAFLTMIDPGMTKVAATFLLHHNKVNLQLDKYEFEEGIISREKYLQSIKQSVIVEHKAKKVLQQTNG